MPPSKNLKSLSAAAREWHARALATGKVAHTDEELLLQAAQQLSTAHAARAVITEEGETYTDRFGAPRLRPQIAIERNALNEFVRLRKALGLGTADAPDAWRARERLGRGAA